MTTRQLTRPPTVGKAQIKKDVLEILKLLETFGALLVRETEAMEKADFKTVDTLQADKKDLAKLYHNSVTVLNGRKEEMSGIEISLREKLVNARTRFTQTLNENMRALDSTKNSAQRLINRILDTARQTVIDERQTNYSPKGRTASYKSATNSLNIDQKF